MVRLPVLVVLGLVSMRADASQCIVQPPQTHLSADRVHPRSRITVETLRGYGADPERLARQVRLRGPDGQLVPWTADRLRARVRFTPDAPLRPGRYLVEVRGDYDIDGNRVQVGERGEVDHSAWFAQEWVEVVDTPVPTPEAPRNAQWSRAHTPPEYTSGGYALTASADADPNAAWVELEIEGAGPVAMADVVDGRVGFRLSRELCVQGTQGVTLPPGGDLKVRLVAVGLEGERVPGPWEVLGPSREGGLFPPPPVAPPLGRPAWTERIETVAPIDVVPDASPTVSIASTCGRMEPVGEETTVGMAPGTRLVVDDGGRIRLVRVLADRIRIDDAEVPLPPGVELVPGLQTVSLAGRGDRPVLGFVDPTGIHVLQSRGSALAAHRVVPADGEGTRLVRFETDGSELIVQWVTATGSRYRQRFGSTLEPAAPIEEILDPVVVDRPTRAIHVNGHAVEGLLGAFVGEHAVWDGTVYVTAYSKGFGHLVATDLRGEVRWHERFPDLGVRSLVVDPFGVHVALRAADGVEPRSFSHYGEIVDPMEPPEPEPLATPRPGPGELRRAVGTRTLVVVQSRPPGFGYAEGNQPPLLTPMPQNAVVGGLPDGAEVGWIAGNAVHRQRYACSGETLGVPHHWLP